MVADSADGGQDWAQILLDLGDKGISGFLAEPGIRTLCLSELEKAGCRPPRNHLVFFALSKALAAAGHFSGNAMHTRLAAFAETNKIFAVFLTRLANLNRQARDQNDLKALMLSELRPAADGGDMMADEATSIEVITALHMRKQLHGLDQGMQTLADELSNDIAEMFANMHEPVLTWSGLTGEHSAVESIRYDSGVYGFRGREAEMDTLHSFLGDLSMTGARSKFRWLLITAPGGEGKTRLAYEFVKDLTEPWIGGKLGRDGIDKLIGEQRWAPRRPTLFVIDYPAQFPDEVGRLLAFLEKRSSHFDLPVRVLLLERDLAEDWFRKMLPSGGDSSKVKRHAFRRNAFNPAWMLDPISQEAVVALMRGRFEDAGLAPPADSELLRAAALADPREEAPPRPLFAAAVAEIGVRRMRAEEPEGWLFAGFDRDAVLDAILDRDRDQRWRPAEGCDARSLEAHENLLAVATLCRGLPRDALVELARDAEVLLPSPARAALVPLDEDLIATMGSRDPTVRIDGLEPDILGLHHAFATLRRLRADGFAQSLLDAAYLADARSAAHMALLASGDFPEAFEAADGLAPVPAAGPEAAQAYAAVAVGMTYIGEQGVDLSRLDAMLARLDVLRAAFPGAEEITFEQAHAAVNVACFAGRDGDWHRVDAMLARLDVLRAAFPGAEEIAFCEALATVNVTKGAGEEGDWDRVDAMLERLDALRGQSGEFRESEAIAFCEGRAAVNVTDLAGWAGEWRRVDAMLVRLDALRAAFPRAEEIAFAEAKAAVAVTRDAGEAGDWDRVDAMLVRLDALRRLFHEAAEIALCEAEAVILAYMFRSQAALGVQIARPLIARLSKVLLEIGNEEVQVSGIQVVKDASARFPNDKTIGEVRAQLSEAGVDWTQIPDLQEAYVEPQPAHPPHRP